MPSTVKAMPGKAALHPLLDQADREMGDVDPDPPPPQLLRGMDRGAAAAERIEHDVARVRRGRDDPLEQRDRLLRRIAEAFRLAVD